MSDKPNTEAPAPQTGTPPAAPSAAPAPTSSPAIDVEKIALLEKDAARAKKLEKELAATQEKMKSPDFIKEHLVAALGLNKEETVDTFKAKFASVESERTKLATENARIRAERAVEKIAFKHEAEDPEEHIDAAIRAGVVGPDFTFDPDALGSWMEKRKAERPRLFKAPPAAAPAQSLGPPVANTKAPPSPTQPTPIPAESTQPATFDSWLGRH